MICVYLIVTRQWNNPWPWNANVTEFPGRAACVPVGEVLVLRGQQPQEVDCFGDTQLRRKFGRGQEAGYRLYIITIICCTPRKARTIVFLTRRGGVLELSAGKSRFSFFICFANIVEPVSCYIVVCRRLFLPYDRRFAVAFSSHATSDSNRTVISRWKISDRINEEVKWSETNRSWIMQLQ